jgi:hypothetical protein
MSRANTKFVVTYVLLVGLPLAGLVAVLRVGRPPAAPVSVGGVWKFEADAARLSALPCAASLPFTPGGLVAVSQSGKSLTLRPEGAAKTAASGSIEGDRVTASVRAADSAVVSCGGGRGLLLLTGVVGGDAGSRTLTGALSVADCDSCEAVEFRAARQSRAVAR